MPLTCTNAVFPLVRGQIRESVAYKFEPSIAHLTIRPLTCGFAGSGVFSSGRVPPTCPHDPRRYCGRAATRAG